MRRHELDPVSLTFGFAFTGLGLLFLIGQADQALRLHWIWPLLLLVLGAGILLDIARTPPRPTPPDPTLEPTRPDQEPQATTAELGPDPAHGGAVDDREQAG
jgi:hypothetical protein